MKKLMVPAIAVLIACGCISITNNIGDSAIKGAEKMSNADAMVSTANMPTLPTNYTSKASGGMVIYNTISSGKDVSPQTTATIPLK